MKKAYPNFSDYMPSSPSYDLQKWMNAMRDVYVKLHLGASKNSAVDQITEDWNRVEKREFLDWLKYYESGDFKKYKKAQHSYYVNDDINYFLPNPQKPNIPSPIRSLNDQISKAPDETALFVKKQQEAQSKEEQRKIIEDQRRKILGRLNSAERLLSSHQGQMFAGPEFERLLSAIYELKKQIQTVNKISLSTQTIADLIIRQANILQMKGHNNARDFMVKFAQNALGDFSVNLQDLPAGGSVPDGASLGNNTPDLTGKDKITEDSAVGKFIDNLESGGITTSDDVSKNDDTNKDEIIIDDDVILDQEIIPEEDEKDDLVVHAQAVSPAENLEVQSPQKTENFTKEEIKNTTQQPVVVKNNYDDLIDSAFGNLTVQDVIDKLEDINQIFKTKEIIRQLSIVELMMDRLGISTYFSELSEILGKQIDSTLYIGSRLENVLSRLTGSIKGNNISLKDQSQKSLSPEVEAVRNNLEQQENKENQRKEINKKKREEKDLQELKPEVQVENPAEELSVEPTNIETPKQPIAPPATIQTPVR